MRETSRLNSDEQTYCLRSSFALVLGLITTSPLFAAEPQVDSVWLPRSIQITTQELAAKLGRDGGEGYASRTSSKLAEARRRFWKHDRDEKDYASARIAFAFALMERDRRLLGIETLARSSKEIGRQLGRPMGRLQVELGREARAGSNNEKPSPGCRGTFSNWVSNARGRKKPVAALDILHSAFVDHEVAYKAYAMRRDRYEYWLAGREDDFFPTNQSFAFYLARTGWIALGPTYPGNGIRSPQKSVAMINEMESLFGKDRFWRVISELRAAEKSESGGLVQPANLGLTESHAHLREAMLSLLAGDSAERRFFVMLYRSGEDVSDKLRKLNTEHGRDAVADAARKVMNAKRTRQNPRVLTSAAAAAIGVFDNRNAYGAFLELLRRSSSPQAVAGALVPVPLEIDGYRLLDEKYGRSVKGIAASEDSLVVLITHESANSRGGRELVIVDRATMKTRHRIPTTPPGGITISQSLVFDGKTAVVYDNSFKQRSDDARLPQRLRPYKSVGAVLRVNVKTGEKSPWLVGPMHGVGMHYRGEGYARSVASHDGLLAVCSRAAQIGENPTRKYSYVEGRVYVYRQGDTDPLYKIDADYRDYGDQPQYGLEFGWTVALGKQFGIVGFDTLHRPSRPAGLIFDATSGKRVGYVPTPGLNGRVEAIAIHGNRALLVAGVLRHVGNSDRVPMAYLISLPDGKILWKTSPAKQEVHDHLAVLTSTKAAFFDGDQVQFLDAETGQLQQAVSLIVDRPGTQGKTKRELDPRNFLVGDGVVGFQAGWRHEAGWLFNTEL